MCLVLLFFGLVDDISVGSVMSINEINKDSISNILNKSVSLVNNERINR